MSSSQSCPPHLQPLQIPPGSYNPLTPISRDELREQHALGKEIADAITNAPIGEAVDEEDLEAELEGMEQEQIDEKMLKTGTIPVNDELSRLPAVGNGEVSAGKGKARVEEEDEEEELRKLQAEMAM
jgi:charged multivesicular body protein 4